MQHSSGDRFDVLVVGREDGGGVVRARRPIVACARERRPVTTLGLTGAMAPGGQRDPS